MKKIAIVFSLLFLLGFSSVNFVSFADDNSLYGLNNLSIGASYDCFRKNEDSKYGLNPVYNIYDDVDFSNSSGKNATFTILSHGLDAKSYSWCNDGTNKISYNSGSIIERMRSINPNILVIEALIPDYPTIVSTIGSETTYNEYNVGMEELKKSSGSDDYKSPITRGELSLVSSETRDFVLVLNYPSNIKDDNSEKTSVINKLYQLIHHTIDAFIQDIVKMGNFDNLSINLIGHSLGGVLNLMYAYQHAEFVDKIFSLDSPFLGSFSSNFSNILESINLVDSNDNIVSELNDPDFELSINDMWRKAYLRNSRIKFHMMGAVTGVGIIQDVLNTLGTSLWSWKVDCVITLLNAFPGIVDWSVFNSKISSMNIPNNYRSKLSLLISSFNKNVYNFDDVAFYRDNSLILKSYFATDFLVNLDSQLGSGTTMPISLDDKNTKDNTDDVILDNKIITPIHYDNVSRVVKNFTADDYDYSKLSYFSQSQSSNNGIDYSQFYKYSAHNLVCQDDFFVNYISKRVYANNYYSSANGDVKYYTTPFENGVAIEDAELINPTSSIIFPNELVVDGVTKPVLKISPNAFSNSCFKNVHFSFSPRGSHLKVLDSNSLSGLKFDDNIVIPSSVELIGYRAFSDAIGVKSIQLHNTDLSIQSAAFYNIPSLEYFIVDSIATKLLINNKSVCCYLGNENKTTLNLDNSIEIIQDFAFANATNLQEVNTQNVTKIGERAFENCSNLRIIQLSSKLKDLSSYSFLNCTSLSSITIPSSVVSIDRYAFDGCSSLSSIIGGENVKYLSYYSFINTKWYNDQTNHVIFNNTYLKYNGDLQIVDLSLFDYLTKISSYAFTNTQVSELVFGKNIEIFEPCAIMNNPNLNTIKIQSDYISQACPKWQTNNSNTIIFYGPITSSIMYQERLFIDDIRPYYSTAKFFMNDDIITINVDYQTRILNMPLVHKDNYDFLGWSTTKDDTQAEVTAESKWLFMDRVVVLYPVFQGTNYSIIYDTRQGDLSNIDITKYSIDNPKTLPICNKKYFDFKGWKTFQGDVITSTNQITEYKDLYLTAVFTGTEYTISYIDNGIAVQKKVRYGEYYHLATSNEEPNFVGWADSLGGEIQTDYRGDSLGAFAFGSNVSYTPSYFLDSFTIRYNQYYTMSVDDYENRFASINELIDFLFQYNYSMNTGFKYQFKLPNGDILSDDTIQSALNSSNECLIQVTFSDEYHTIQIENDDGTVSTLSMGIYFPINLSSYVVQKDGYIFDSFVVKTSSLNSNIFVSGVVFSYSTMPDLSPRQGIDGEIVIIPLYHIINHEIKCIIEELNKSNTYEINQEELSKTLIPIEVKGKKFNGWKDTNGLFFTNEEGAINRLIDTDIILYADYSIQTYSISYEINVPKENENPDISYLRVAQIKNTTSYTIDTKFVFKKPMVLNSHYHFLYWKVKGTNDVIFELNNNYYCDLILTAVFYNDQLIYS